MPFTQEDAMVGMNPAMQSNPCPRCDRADMLMDNQCGCCILCYRCTYKYPKQRYAK